MIIENIPNYSPAGHSGFTATYNINFSVDVNHAIPLNAMLQGSAIFAKTLYVNNYNSTYSITIGVGSSNLIIPPYTAAHVDIRGLNIVTLTSASSFAGIITCQVADYVVPYGMQSRTFDTVATSDPYWNRVNYASYCEGANNATSIFDEKGLTFTTINAVAGNVSTTKYKFGISSIRSLSSVGTSYFSLINAPTQVYSFDFFFNVDSGMVPGTYNVFSMRQVGSPNINTWDYCVTVTSTHITHIVIAETWTPGITATIALPTPIPCNEWHYGACNVADNTNISHYLNGSLIRNGPVTAMFGVMTEWGFGRSFGAGVNGISGYIDEPRVTSYPRFVGAAPIPEHSFFNQ